MKQKRDPEGPEWVMLVDSPPHWKPSVIIQMILDDDCIAELKEKCIKAGWTILFSQPAPKCEDGQARYLSGDEMRQALKARRLLTPERAKLLERAVAIKVEFSK
jgi:hypothetical protein